MANDPKGRLERGVLFEPEAGPVDRLVAHIVVAGARKSATALRIEQGDDRLCIYYQQDGEWKLDDLMPPFKLFALIVDSFLRLAGVGFPDANSFTEGYARVSGPEHHVHLHIAIHADDTSCRVQARYVTAREMPSPIEN